MNIGYTSHSEIGKIKTLFIKNVKQAFISETHIEQYWAALNFLGKPDFRIALREYETFQTILKKNDAEIHYLPEDSSVNMDSVYCRGASIATNKGMIICNMGKPGRMNEPLAEKMAFEANGFPVLGCITAPGTLEGGDVAWLDENTLAIGHTYRTNEEGIRQLTALLQPIGVEVIVVPLPHYKGAEDVFHLMSIFSPVDTDLAVLYSPLMPIIFRDSLIRRGYHLIEVPDEEFGTMGCNVLALEPKICLMVDGNPKTKTLLENKGCKVILYKGDEISIKGGGGPTCLTRPIHRYN
jgi:N-dimethylarginine dimethylaminohydrolase